MLLLKVMVWCHQFVIDKACRCGAGCGRKSCESYFLEISRTERCVGLLTCPDSNMLF